MALKVPIVLKNLAKTFSTHGFECYLVGGAIRDMVRGMKPDDYDVATDATPDEVVNIFKRVIPTGVKHGTVTVLYEGQSIEVTTFRIDGTYSDARRPDDVAFTRSIQEDLKRRDFTVNGMALNCSSGKLLDPCNGIKDLEYGIIRAIGNAEERFQEDALRILRGCRFAAQLESTIEQKTFNAMAKLHDSIEKVSAERIQDELIKTLISRVPSIGLKAMEENGILSVLIPELLECRDVCQDFPHSFDVLDHLYASCDGASKSNIAVRLSALFHDIGKPKSLSSDENDIANYHGHEKTSAEIAGAILKRLKCSNALISKVVHLVKTHMWSYSDSWTDAAVRRFVKRVGKESLSDVFALRHADGYGMGRKVRADPRSEALQQRIEDLITHETALLVKDLSVNGNDLKHVGIPHGPVLGIVLDELLETVIDDPKQNTKDRLLEIARNFYENRLSGT